MFFDVSIAKEIWAAKYRFGGKDGLPGDADFDATAARVAAAAAGNESDIERPIWQARFEDAIAKMQFIPAGRILAGAGTDRAVTLFNCFVMGTIPDSLEGIFDHLKQAALTMQQGGGVGMDFSTIRPRGAEVKGVGSDASGPLSFMDCWDSMCRTVHSAGARRGAMMGCLRIDHPDIEDFIDAKRDGARFRNFNLSVLVSDAFMAALEQDGEWPLAFDGTIYRTVQARALWDRLMQATYDVAEPGVIFIDRVNQKNNLAYCETISASNPCGEQMLPPYGACLLGSINLAALVDNPFEEGAAIDEASLADLTATAIRFLDNIIDISRYPLAEQEAEAKAKRRIGLGITGLADALLFCGRAYGSEAAIQLTERWLTVIRDAAYRASARLAEEKGAFPLYDAAMLDQPNLLALDAETRALISSHGLRNGCLTSIAPTGTTSLLAGNVSSGVEPVFAYSYQRRILNPDGSARHETVEDYALRAWRQVKGDAVPPDDLFVSAQSLDPAAHVRMQAAAQALIDSSISKTVNVPEDISFDDFSDVYLDGYRRGCKGLTTYRPNSVTGSVLSVAPVEEPAQSQPVLEQRDEALEGTTYKLKWPDSAHAVYVTINNIDADGAVRPFEIFINSKNMEHYAWTLGLTRMISAVFRRGGDVSFVADELKAVFDPRGGSWMNGKYVPSLLAAIGGIIEKHLHQFAPGQLELPVIPRAAPASQAAAPGGPICPQCSATGMIREEGCNKCLECGYSKCG
ncbi:adenosylcobalamin-dependent ribonucleoside-diphosphate reductase [Sphingorhabdus sp.]|jgi:ribonucleoside-diphosphate reductase alpha chain|uniref:adenosylcobalamin-dependent ribonucleoside-diphosphate reductase n=1 Tax=Sphingorhabdus sp. TaxID=1902408 RepID=UPI0035B4E78F|nr:adenosylcobalamin-dependent ribonucleoside-diphosphate reductase [Sphingomonadaceae bacterium]